MQWRCIRESIVREVYRIDEWHDAGTSDYQTRDTREFMGSGRKEFLGWWPQTSEMLMLAGLSAKAVRTRFGM